MPGPDERRFTVRWHRSRKCLTADPETTWRWSEPSQATPMTRAEADAAAARMGGVVCVDGVPVDRLSIEPPKRPDPVRGPRRGDATAEVRAHVAAGRLREATRIAMKLRGLGEDASTLARAWDGYTKPVFCRELRRDPEALIAAGAEVLRRRWGSA